MICGILSKSSRFSDIHIWLLGQAVKTPPFHGGNAGSIPAGVTKSARIKKLKKLKKNT